MHRIHTVNDVPIYPTVTSDLLSLSSERNRISSVLRLVHTADKTVLSCLDPVSNLQLLRSLTSNYSPGRRDT